MFYGGEHLTHDVGCLMFAESLGCNDTVKEFTTWAVLHDNVDVSMIDVALVKLYDVWVIDSPQNCELFLQESNILRNTLAKNGLDGVSMGRVGLFRCCAASSKMTTTNHFNEVID